MDKTKLLEKKWMVDALSGVLAEHLANVESVSYEVFINEEKGWTQEYLVYHYDGGAILARNCNWNSKTAIIDEIAKYTNGGYYDEVDDYRLWENKVGKDGWTKLI